jgi:hypothetical protein
MAQDTAAAVATNSHAPAAERYEAQVEAYAPAGLANLIPAGEIQPVIDYINSSLAEQEFEKSLRSNVVPFPSKSRPRGSERGPQSVFLDDFQLLAQGEFWDRPGLLDFDGMRAMVEQTPLLNSIVLTRIRQVSRFCRVSANGVGPGFQIAHVDKTVELKEDQQASVQIPPSSS